jgi:transcriptional regulator with XRE-family HTH domain
MERTNAGARYRELGAELRERRVWAGLNGKELAERIGWSQAMITRIETGQRTIKPIDVYQYLGFCKVYGPNAQDMFDLATDAARKLGYWLSPHGEWLQDSLRSLIYHETAADRSITYEPLLIPGLLQTADYARARIAAEEWRSEFSVEECVRIRRQRQRILHAPNPAKFRFYVHEQALRLEVGSPAIMHEQLLKLVLLAALDHVTVRVVPLSAGERSAFGGPFVVFEYAEYPPLVYLHATSNGLFLEDKEFVEPFRRLLPAMAAIALDEGQSRELIAALASGYDQRSERDVGDHLEEEQL